MEMNYKDYVGQYVVNRLMEAMENAAVEGRGADAVRVSKYLLRLAKKLDGLKITVPD